MQTLGISPKVFKAFLYPFAVTLLAAAVDWLSSNQFDVTTIRIALAGFGASLLAALGSYRGSPGNVVSTSQITTNVPEDKGDEKAVQP